MEPGQPTGSRPAARSADDVDAASLGAAAHRVLAAVEDALRPMHPLFLALSLRTGDGTLRPVAITARTRSISHRLAQWQWYSRPGVVAAARGEAQWCGWPRLRTELPELTLPPVEAGAWAALPLGTHQPIGALFACFADSLRFGARERQILEGLARFGATALADGIDCAAKRAAADHALEAERARLAADLHDGVVQQVIATSMALAGLVGAVPPAHRDRITQLVHQHDEIVSQLRATIFALHAANPWSTSAAAELVHVVDEAAAALGFRPELRMHGDLTRIDTVTQLSHLMFVARELLSNVARHSGASSALVAVSVDDARIVLRVDDDGHGIPALPPAGNGLANLHRRARMLDGECRFHTPPDGGTSVEWSIPVTVSPHTTHVPRRSTE